MRKGFLSSTRLVPLIPLALIGACAVIMSGAPQITDKPISAYATEQSFADEPADWFADDWSTTQEDPNPDAVNAEVMSEQPALVPAVVRRFWAPGEAEIDGAAIDPQLSAAKTPAASDSHRIGRGRILLSGVSQDRVLDDRIDEKT